MLFSMVRWLVYIYTCVTVLVIVGTHLHYTLDVAIAVALTWHVFSLYHRMIDLSLHKNVPIVSWLEAEEVMNLEKEVFEKFLKTE